MDLKGTTYRQMQKTDSREQCLGPRPFRSSSPKTRKELHTVESTGHRYPGRSCHGESKPSCCQNKERNEMTLIEIADSVTSTGPCSSSAKCSFKHDDQKGDKRQRTPSPKPQRKPTRKLETNNRTGTSPSGKEDRPPCLNTRRNSAHGTRISTTAFSSV